MLKKRPSSKATASEGARRTLRYVKPLSDARTPLEDLFSILLEGDPVIERPREQPFCRVGTGLNFFRLETE